MNDGLEGLWKEAFMVHGIRVALCMSGGTGGSMKIITHDSHFLASNVGPPK